jgi:signal transduction histidine kinase
MITEQLHFKTNIQLKSIIGKDLINDDNIAVLELVKNSFDANAKRVDITFNNLKNNDDTKIKTFSKNTTRIIIQDDGLGMDIKNIRDKWLNIAYSEKKLNIRQHNRMMAGAKGVGRFSCDRLGEYLNLYAKKDNADRFTLLKIDWKRFEIEDDKQEIQSVMLEYEELSANELQAKGIKPFKNGVVLEIIKLRSKWVYETKDSKGCTTWNTDKLVNLRKYLEKLINPNQAFEKNDFGIYLNVPEFIIENNKKEEHNKFIGKVENTIFGKLDFKTTSIESEIVDNGNVILTTLKDKGQIIFWIKEKNDFLPELINVKVIIYFLSQYTKAFFTKQTGIRPLEYGSIYLFLNGFRIPPYGQESDDWLKLEQRRAQGYARNLSQRELVGRIEVLDYKNYFKVVTSREGLEKNESYNKLVQGTDSFFYKVFRRLERYVVDGLNWDSATDENRNNWSEIEKKIISGNVDENSLEYKEDELTKKRRIYQSIHSIIGARNNNVIELYINENLILEKVQEEKVNAEREFEQLVIDFENKKIDSETLNRILQRKAVENEDLKKQIADFSKYSINEMTSKAIVELQRYKDMIEKQTRIIEDLKLRLEKEQEANIQYQQKLAQLQQISKTAEEKAKIETEKRIEAEKETEKIKIQKDKEIHLEKLKVEFYKKQSTPETDALIHHVKNNNIAIKEYILLIINNISEYQIDTNFKNIMIKDLHEVLHLANKALKATELILESNLENADAQKINLPSFITGYFNSNYHDIKMHMDNNVGIFQIIGSKLDLALVFDALIDNSKKWDAKNIWIKTKMENNRFILNIYDDGKGLSQKFALNPNEIFEFRKTASSKGTGFGLYLVFESLLKMNAIIEIDKPQIGNGMNFKIVFK